MRNLIRVLVVGILLVAGLLWYVQMRGAVPQASTIVTADAGVTSASDATVTCYENAVYLVAVRAHKDAAGSDMLVKYKTNGGKLLCSFTKSNGDFEISLGEEPDYFLAINSHFLLLDSGTAPDPRGLIVYDLVTRARVFTDRYARPIDLAAGTITYWTPVSEKPTASNCPNLATYTSQGLGAVLESHVTLDLSSLAKRDLGDMRCAATQ